MEETKKTKSYKNLFIIVVALLLVVFAVNWYIGVKEQAFLSISNDVIYEQETELYDLLGSLNNSAPTDSSLVSDCSAKNRQRFDDLLAKLGSLNRNELIELDSIFGGCAYYFSTLKANKAEILELEIEAYKNYLRVASSVDNELEQKLMSVETWNEVSRLAREQAGLLNKLVNIQSDIIDLLLAYNSINSSVVQEKVAQAQEIRENIVFIDQQIAELKVGLSES